MYKYLILFHFWVRGAVLKKLVNVGFGNKIATSRIISIMYPNSAPVKRMITDAKELKKLMDASCGRKCKSILVLDTEHIVISALSPETIALRVEKLEE